MPSGDQIEIQNGCIKAGDEEAVADAIRQIEFQRLAERSFEWASVTSSEFLTFISNQRNQLSSAIKELGTILLRAYYVDPLVRDAVGVGSRPPFPLGYTMPENNLYALEAVYDRGQIYREVEH